MRIILGHMNWISHGVKITHLSSSIIEMPGHKIWVDFDPSGYRRYKDEIENWLSERGIEIGEWYDPATVYTFYAYMSENQAFEFRLRFA